MGAVTRGGIVVETVSTPDPRNICADGEEACGGRAWTRGAWVPWFKLSSPQASFADCLPACLRPPSRRRRLFLLVRRFPQSLGATNTQ